MRYIHISIARKIMDSPEPFDIRFFKKNGDIEFYRDVVSLSYDFYRGTRRLKFVKSGQIRMIRDVLVIEINGMRVGL